MRTFTRYVESLSNRQFVRWIKTRLGKWRYNVINHSRTCQQNVGTVEPHTIPLFLKIAPHFPVTFQWLIAPSPKHWPVERIYLHRTNIFIDTYDNDGQSATPLATVSSPSKSFSGQTAKSVPSRVDIATWIGEFLMGIISLFSHFRISTRWTDSYCFRYIMLYERR
jgi:hypothetical protein